MLVGEQGSERTWKCVLADVGPDQLARREAVKMLTRLMHHASAGRRRLLANVFELAASAFSATLSRITRRLEAVKMFTRLMHHASVGRW